MQEARAPAWQRPKAQRPQCFVRGHTARCCCPQMPPSTSSRKPGAQGADQTGRDPKRQEASRASSLGIGSELTGAPEPLIFRWVTLGRPGPPRGQRPLWVPRCFNDSSALATYVLAGSSHWCLPSSLCSWPAPSGETEAHTLGPQQLSH